MMTEPIISAMEKQILDLQNKKRRLAERLEEVLLDKYWSFNCFSAVYPWQSSIGHFKKCNAVNYWGSLSMRRDLVYGNKSLSCGTKCAGCGLEFTVEVKFGGNPLDLNNQNYLPKVTPQSDHWTRKVWYDFEHRGVLSEWSEAQLQWALASERFYGGDSRFDFAWKYSKVDLTAELLSRQVADAEK